MNISSFLKQQIEKKEQQEKENTDKENFRQKCQTLLAQIKEINEERYQELNKVFHQGYDKINVQRKKLLGLHGQLVNELNTLKQKAGVSVEPAKVAAKNVIKQVKGGANQVKKNIEEVSRATKKMADQVVTEVKGSTALSKQKTSKEAKKAEPKKANTVADKKVANKSAPAKKSAAKSSVSTKKSKPAAKKSAKKG